MVWFVYLCVICVCLCVNGICDLCVYVVCVMYGVNGVMSVCMYISYPWKSEDRFLKNFILFVCLVRGLCMCT